MIESIVIAIAFAIFTFVFLSALSVGFGLLEKISLAVALVGVGVASLACFALARVELNYQVLLETIRDPVHERWLAIAWLGGVIASISALILFISCIRRTWLKRRTIFPFIYGRGGDA